MTLNSILPLLTCVILACFAGCADEIVDDEGSAPQAKTKTKSRTIAPERKGPKTTDEIGEFDPNAGKEVVDSKVKYSNPITGPLEAYEPLKQKVSELAITRAIQLFHATEGRYPRDHEEFMARVIKENHVRLPQLSADKRYEYDVQNHELLVVRDAPQQQ